MLETGWSGVEQGASGNVRQFLNDGAAQRVTLFAPTATEVGGILAGPDGHLLNVNKLDTADAFINDQIVDWSRTIKSRVALRPLSGVDARTTAACLQLRSACRAGGHVPGDAMPTWNSVAPRVGLTLDLRDAMGAPC